VYIDIVIVYTLNAMCQEAGLPYPCDITDTKARHHSSRVPSWPFKRQTQCMKCPTLPKGPWG